MQLFQQTINEQNQKIHKAALKQRIVAYKDSRGADHKGLEAHIHFLLIEHNFDFPALGVMGKDFLVRKT